MENQQVFNFKTNLTAVFIPEKLNNPFGAFVPAFAKIAAKELQEFIVAESPNWGNDFLAHKGKMFGVLVVQKKDLSFGYLAAVSGKLPGNVNCKEFVPSVFDESVGDFFIRKGMLEITAIGLEIKAATSTVTINALKEKRKIKSNGLQKRLFENYYFSNLSGKTENILEIFKGSDNESPPAAAGECAAPKLLQFALQENLKPIALGEFWWGIQHKNKERIHQSFYPACKNKCRPILEYMLENDSLYLAGVKP
ncbi:pseudouridylate synthase [Putridiphycobacter roseus]|uniref:Pseudouridylate synthase n=1 Tax=Putridiphycobacter roseus TaxID=2219161 RepID=A0A2W1NHC4_9FLAO|nr:pseudouridylate synthase [Putridiphycobacter roseus]PZE17396.1 pseudouridylate synthase [Putridiphycobacter roseus]